MVRHFPQRLALCFSLCVGVSVYAAEQEPRLLASKSIQARLLLPAPPSVGSDESKAEIDEMLAIQAMRTDAQVKRFHSQERLGIGTFQGAMPDWWRPDDFPKLNKLFRSVAKEASEPIDSAKQDFKRARPEREDSRIQPLAHFSDFSYPSGHAARGLLYAKILAEVAPDRADALRELGREIGWNRVIGGVHHPSDISAGRVLGLAIAAALLKNPDFKVQLEEAQQEYEAAKKSHAESAAPVLVH